MFAPTFPPSLSPPTAGVDVSSNLVYSEVQGDLFTCPSHFSLGHCVSEDMAMGRGVATFFKSMFNSVGELKKQGIDVRNGVRPRTSNIRLPP